jgi:1-pyrroline-5-carboxylate dehydrogenase
LAIANGTIFGLTGAVYSNQRERLEQARAEFHVGNLYFNRKCTGALVGVHPFGGFNIHERDGQQGRRSRLLAAVHTGKERGGTLVAAAAAAK